MLLQIVIMAISFATPKTTEIYFMVESLKKQKEQCVDIGFS